MEELANWLNSLQGPMLALFAAAVALGSFIITPLCVLIGQWLTRRRVGGILLGSIPCAIVTIVAVAWAYAMMMGQNQIPKSSAIFLPFALVSWCWLGMAHDGRERGGVD